MRILDKIAFVSIFAVFVGMLVVGFMLFWPVKVVEITNDPVPVNQIEVLAGQYIQLEVKACKYKDIPSNISRTLVDTIIITYENIHFNAPLGCNTLPVNVKIPDYVASGEYFFRTFIEYQVNPLRKEVVSYESQRFYVKGLVDKLPEVVESR